MVIVFNIVRNCQVVFKSGCIVGALVAQSLEWLALDFCSGHDLMGHRMELNVPTCPVESLLEILSFCPSPNSNTCAHTCSHMLSKNINLFLKEEKAYNTKTNMVSKATFGSKKNSVSSVDIFHGNGPCVVLLNLHMLRELFRHTKILIPCIFDLLRMPQGHLFLNTQLLFHSATGNFNFGKRKPEVGKQICHNHQMIHSRSGANDLWINMTNGKLAATHIIKCCHIQERPTVEIR